MALDLDHPPIWLKKLDLVRAALEYETRPSAPGDGIVAACRLSDDVRALALASLRAQHPDLSPHELQALHERRRDEWRQARQRLFDEAAGSTGARPASDAPRHA